MNTQAMLRQVARSYANAAHLRGKWLSYGRYGICQAADEVACAALGLRPFTLLIELDAMDNPPWLLAQRDEWIIRASERLARLVPVEIEVTV